MQYEATTPAEYIDQLEDDWRRQKVESLRSILQSHAPELDEGIHYKMLSYGDEKGQVFHLNAQKNYVSLYVGDASKVDPEGVLLQGLDVGKGCIRFKKSVSVADTRIDEFVARTAELWKRGVDVGC